MFYCFRQLQSPLLLFIYELSLLVADNTVKDIFKSFFLQINQLRRFLWAKQKPDIHISNTIWIYSCYSFTSFTFLLADKVLWITLCLYMCSLLWFRISPITICQLYYRIFKNISLLIFFKCFSYQRNETLVFEVFFFIIINSNNIWFDKLNEISSLKYFYNFNIPFSTSYTN